MKAKQKNGKETKWKLPSLIAEKKIKKKYNRKKAMQEKEMKIKLYESWIIK